MLSVQEADMSDLEHLQRTTDDYWFISVCIEKLHRLPSELEDIGMSQVCLLRAYGIVSNAYDHVVRGYMRRSSGQR